MGSTRIEFERSGGFGGVTLSRSIDSSELDAEEAAELERLLDSVDLEAAASAPAPRGGGADRFQYDVEVDRGAGRHRLRVGEGQLTPELKALMDKLAEMARRR